MTVELSHLQNSVPAAATRPELELLLCCARTHVDPKTAKRINNLVQQDIDWAYLIQTAKCHKVMPLLYSSLKSSCSKAVPLNILDQLQNFIQANTQKNLFLTRELLALLELFELHKISAIPYKGPVLAASVYGSLALRQFVDLDILVPKRQYLKAQELLMSQGYSPPPQNNVDWERSFVHAYKKVGIDLHQGITPSYLPFPIDFEALWERLEPISLAGTRVKCLSPEDLLIVLCVQLAKDSQWTAEVLIKICDIAELIHGHQKLDWDRVWQQCVKLGSKRMLLFSLYVVRELLKTDVPDSMLKKMQADTVAKEASAQVCKELFNRSEESFRERTFKERIYLRKLGKERWQDKLRYAIIPNEKDLELLPLPKCLFFFYYLLRPLRLIGKHFQIASNNF